jgi:hypothetical protein
MSVSDSCNVLNLPRGQLEGSEESYHLVQEKDRGNVAERGQNEQGPINLAAENLIIDNAGNTNAEIPTINSKTIPDSFQDMLRLTSELYSLGTDHKENTHCCIGYCCLRTEPVENAAFPLLRSGLGSDHIENMSHGVCIAKIANTCHQLSTARTSQYSGEKLKSGVLVH